MDETEEMLPCEPNETQAFIDGVRLQLETQLSQQPLVRGVPWTTSFECPRCKPHVMRIAVDWDYFPGAEAVEGVRRDEVPIDVWCNCRQNHQCDPAHPGCGQEYRYWVPVRGDLDAREGPIASGASGSHVLRSEPVPADATYHEH